ncbi:hypothetical protein BVRB_026030, partial [Beta vulgaris subsp. vulgaris]
PYESLVKEVVGHPAGQNPNDPSLVALQVPVPTGAALPALVFFPAAGLPRGSVGNLTNIDIDDIEWFYNVRIPGANLNARQTNLELFPAGLL